MENLYSIKTITYPFFLFLFFLWGVETPDRARIEALAMAGVFIVHTGTKGEQTCG